MIKFGEKTDKDTKLNSKGNGLIFFAGLFAFLALIIWAAYSPVLFDFFNGDDFVHLTWLPEAIKNPQLIYKNFYSSWLDGTTTKFYRPLISVFMVSDYLLWGVNGLGFRFTNLAFHYASSVLLFFITRKILDGQENFKSQANYIALFSASIFALYPLHPEAVSWITGRVDAVVATFYLASLWSYIKWRTDKNILWALGSGISLILGLLSKEMAITLPALFMCYEFILLNDSLKTKAINTIVKTIPFWTILAGYFVLRKYALGTFVGGYDDSLFFISNLKSFALSWVHALRMLIIPINKQLLGEHSLLTKTWEVLIVAAVTLTILKLSKIKEYRLPIIFCILWLVTALLPVYKIFAIGNDLQGSRLAYVATIPVSVLLAFAFIWLKPVHENTKNIWAFLFSKNISLLAALALIITAGTILWVNNQAYREAGIASNAIRQSIAKLYKTLPGDPQVLLLGLPDQINGAYVCRNALWGMTKKPQLVRDINNCLLINPFEPILPFGYLKDSLAQNQEQVKIYFWSKEKSDFEPITLSRNTAKADITFKDVNLNDKQNQFGRPYIDFNLAKLPCWTTDFVALSLQIDSAKEVKKDTGADLLYTNNLQPDFALEHRTHSPLDLNKKTQTLIFSLRALPQWSFGKECKQIRILFPAGLQAKINSLSIISKEKLMPALTFKNSDYLGTKGYLHLDNNSPNQTIRVDNSKISGAHKTAIEITKTNLLFEDQNCTTKSQITDKYKIYPTTTADIVLEKKEFPGTGIYELRAWALDDADNIVGVCSDHIVISSDP